MSPDVVTSREPEQDIYARAQKYWDGIAVADPAVAKGLATLAQYREGLESWGDVHEDLRRDAKNPASSILSFVNEAQDFVTQHANRVDTLFAKGGRMAKVRRINTVDVRALATRTRSTPLVVPHFSISAKPRRKSEVALESELHEGGQAVTKKLGAGLSAGFADALFKPKKK